MNRKSTFSLHMMEKLFFGIPCYIPSIGLAIEHKVQIPKK